MEKLNQHTIFYLHMAFDEYISDIGNSDLVTITEMNMLVRSEEFKKIFTDIYGSGQLKEEKQNRDNILDQIKKVYNSSLNSSYSSWDGEMTIFMFGYTGHSTSIVMNSDGKKVKIAVINSGGGVDYHGISIANGEIRGNVIVSLTIDSEYLPDLLALIGVANLRRTSQSAATNDAFLYEIIISKIYEFSDENSKGILFHQCRSANFPTQLGGSCTFYSVFYPMYWIMHHNDTNLNDKTNIEKFEKLKYMLALYAINSHIKNMTPFNKVDSFTVRQLSRYKLQLIKDKYPDIGIVVENDYITKKTNDVNYTGLIDHIDKSAYKLVSETSILKKLDINSLPKMQDSMTIESIIRDMEKVSSILNSGVYENRITLNMYLADFMKKINTAKINKISPSDGATYLNEINKFETAVCFYLLKNTSTIGMHMMSLSSIYKLYFLSIAGKIIKAIDDVIMKQGNYVEFLGNVSRNKFTYCSNIDAAVEVIDQLYENLYAVTFSPEEISSLKNTMVKMNIQITGSYERNTVYCMARLATNDVFIGTLDDKLKIKCLYFHILNNSTTKIVHDYPKKNVVQGVALSTSIDNRFIFNSNYSVSIYTDGEVSNDIENKSQGYYENDENNPLNVVNSIISGLYGISTDKLGSLHIFEEIHIPKIFGMDSTGKFISDCFSSIAVIEKLRHATKVEKKTEIKNNVSDITFRDLIKTSKILEQTNITNILTVLSRKLSYIPTKLLCNIIFSVIILNTLSSLQLQTQTIELLRSIMSEITCEGLQEYEKNYVVGVKLLLSLRVDAVDVKQFMGYCNYHLINKYLIHNKGREYEPIYKNNTIPNADDIYVENSSIRLVIGASSAEDSIIAILFGMIEHKNPDLMYVEYDCYHEGIGSKYILNNVKYGTSNIALMHNISHQILYTDNAFYEKFSDVANNKFVLNILNSKHKDGSIYGLPMSPNENKYQDGKIEVSLKGKNLIHQGSVCTIAREYECGPIRYGIVKYSKDADGNLAIENVINDTVTINYKHDKYTVKISIIQKTCDLISTWGNTFVNHDFPSHIANWAIFSNSLVAKDPINDTYYVIIFYEVSDHPNSIFLTEHKNKPELGGGYTLITLHDDGITQSFTGHPHDKSIDNMRRYTDYVLRHNATYLIAPYFHTLHHTSSKYYKKITESDPNIKINILGNILEYVTDDIMYNSEIYPPIYRLKTCSCARKIHVPIKDAYKIHIDSISENNGLGSIHYFELYGVEKQINSVLSAIVIVIEDSVHSQMSDITDQIMSLFNRDINDFLIFASLIGKHNRKIKIRIGPNKKSIEKNEHLNKRINVITHIGGVINDTSLVLTDSEYTKITERHNEFNGILDKFVTLSEPDPTNETKKYYTNFRRSVANKCTITDNKKDKQLYCQLIGEPKSDSSDDIKCNIVNDMNNFLSYHKLHKFTLNTDGAMGQIVDIRKKLDTLCLDYYTKYSSYPWIDMIYMYTVDSKREHIIEFIIYRSILNKLYKLGEKDPEMEFDNRQNYIHYPKLINKEYVLYVMIFEIMIGNYLRCSQLKMINDIVGELAGGGGRASIHQLLMGGGKSSVIAPLLTIILTHHKINGHVPRGVLHCMPPHLVKQSIQYMTKISRMLTGLIKCDKNQDPIHLNVGTCMIASDNALKKYVLSKEFFDNRKNNNRDLLPYIIFDEIHDLADNRKTELNMVTLEEKLNDIGTLYDTSVSIFDFFYRKKIQDIGLIYDPVLRSKSARPDPQLIKKLRSEIYGASFNDKSKQFFKLVDIYLHIIIRKRYAIDYGSRIGPKYGSRSTPTAVPYVASNKPHMSNEFSDSNITAMLTICMYRYYCNFDETTVKEYISHIITNDDEDSIQQLEDCGVKINVLFPKQSIVPNKKFSDAVIRKICIFIISHFVRVTAECLNSSFIDLLDENFSLYKSGFTGTPFINLIDGKIADDVPINYISYNGKPLETRSQWKDVMKTLYDSQRTKFQDIAYQIGANGEIFYAMTSGSIKYDSSLTSDSVIRYTISEKYAVLLDIAGVFTSSDSVDIVKKVLNENHYKYGVYIDKQDNKMMLLPGNETPVEYNQDMIEFSSTFTFFDQSHMIGTDIQLDLNCKGLAVIDDRCIYSSVAQGIFRMRNINKGQSVDILHNIDYSFNIFDVPFYLIDQELRYRADNFPFFIEQCAKTAYVSSHINENNIYGVKAIVQNKDVSISQEKEKEKEKEKVQEKEEVRLLKTYISTLNVNASGLIYSKLFMGNSTVNSLHNETFNMLLYKSPYCNVMISKLAGPATAIKNYWGIIIKNNILYLALYHEILTAMYTLPEAFEDNDIIIIDYNNNIVYQSASHKDNDKTDFLRGIFLLLTGNRYNNKYAKLVVSSEHYNKLQKYIQT